MEIPKIITEICLDEGFDYARYLGVYKGWQVYAPMIDSPFAAYGRPRFLHKKGDEIRWSKNHNEALEVLNKFDPN